MGASLIRLTRSRARETRRDELDGYFELQTPIYDMFSALYIFIISIRHRLDSTLSLPLSIELRRHDRQNRCSDAAYNIDPPPPLSRLHRNRIRLDRVHLKANGNADLGNEFIVSDPSPERSTAINIAPFDVEMIDVFNRPRGFALQDMCSPY